MQPTEAPPSDQLQPLFEQALDLLKPIMDTITQRTGGIGFRMYSLNKRLEWTLATTDDHRRALIVGIMTDARRWHWWALAMERLPIMQGVRG